MIAMKEKLKRTLTLFDTTLAGIGIIVGAGIYAIIGKAAGIVGNAVWLSFLIGAVVAGITAMSYAELSSLFPKAGAEYVYARRSFGNRIAFVVNWLLVLGTVFSVATVSLGFASYLNYFIQVPYFISAALLIIIFTALNIYGIKESILVANLGSVIEVLGLVLIIVFGFSYLGDVDYFALPPDSHPSVLFLGASLLFFAFLGFESVPRLAEETRDAEGVIPKAVLLSLAVSTVLYILVAMITVSVVNWSELSASDAPLAMVAENLLGSKVGVVLALIALFSTANTVLIMLVTTTRLLYGLGEGGRGFRRLGEVSKRKTPWIAAILLAVLSLIAVAREDIKFVAYSADFTTFFVFGTINLAVVWFRLTKPWLKPGFRTPDILGLPLLPMVGAATCVLLALTSSLESIVLGLALTALGFAAYEVLKKIKLID